MKRHQYSEDIQVYLWLLSDPKVAVDLFDRGFKLYRELDKSCFCWKENSIEDKGNYFGIWNTVEGAVTFPRCFLQLFETVGNAAEIILLIQAGYKMHGACGVHKQDRFCQLQTSLFLHDLKWNGESMLFFSFLGICLKLLHMHSLLSLFKQKQHRLLLAKKKKHLCLTNPLCPQRFCLSCQQPRCLWFVY